jgi:hypothetical protein
LHHGGDPRDLDALPYATIADWLAVHDLLDARQSIGGVPES